MLDAYDQIRIINLNSRADRRTEMISELQRLGLEHDPRVQFFDAIVPEGPGKWRTVGEHGCYMSHLSLLRSAEAAGENILLLEDDCDFTDAASTSKWGLGSEIFYGGFRTTDYSRLQTGDIEGAHCMGFHRDILTRLVAFLEKSAESPLPIPVDGAYVEFRRANPELLTEFAIPQVAVQRQSRSDITPGKFDRNKWLSLIASPIRKLNRGRHRRRRMMDGL